MKPISALFVMILAASPVFGGIYCSIEQTNPLPAQWRGYLRDQRELRLLAGKEPAISPAYDRYAELRARLESVSRTGRLSAAQAADLGTVYLRLQQTDKALSVLRAAARQGEVPFELQANLAAAWQQSGDLASAIDAHADAMKLAPAKFRPAEELHHAWLLQLRGSAKNAARKAPLIDANPATNEHLAALQQLAIWFPTEGRLVWELGELAGRSGDVRTAANLLEGAVVEFGLRDPVLLADRQKYRAATDAIDAKPEPHAPHISPFKFASARAFASRFDVSKLPPIKPSRTTDLPWAALAETVLGKRFPPAYLPYVAKLDGRRVRLSGYMRPAAGADEVMEFLLTEFPVGCWFCELPELTAIVRVELAPGNTITFQRTPLTLVGEWSLNTSDPESQLFVLKNAKIAITD